jgi:hypothetical protein
LGTLKTSGARFLEVPACINGGGKFSPLRFDMVTDEHETEVEYMHVEWVNKQRNEVP